MSENSNEQSNPNNKTSIAKTSFLALSIATIALMLILVMGDLQKVNSKLDQIIDSGLRDQSAPTPEQLSLMVKEQMQIDEVREKTSQFNRISSKYASATKEVPDAEPVYGRPDAPFSIIEFSDFECPYCARFHESAKSAVDAAAGRVNWVWKNYPLSFHNPVAKDAAVASECVKRLVGNRAFWTFADMYFERSQLNGKGVPGGVRELALYSGVDEQKLDQCLADKAVAEYVDAEMEFGSRNGVTGTPGVFVMHNASGEVRKLPGAVPPEQIMQALSQLERTVSSQ